MGASVYAVIYMFSEALSVVYTQPTDTGITIDSRSTTTSYDLTSRQASLVILAIGVGAIFSFLPRIKDIRMANHRARSNKPIQPEDKLFGFYLAAPILAIGLWWFALTVPPLVSNISPWVSIASLLLIGYAVVEFDNVLSGYLTDTYASFAASANAPMSFLRAVLSGLFPLVGRDFFVNMGNNTALFILAAIATAFCGVAVLIKVYGQALRKRSHFAEKTWEATEDGQKARNLEDPEMF
jgi:hypothetical protein